MGGIIAVAFLSLWQPPSDLPRICRIQPDRFADMEALSGGAAGVDPAS